MFFENYFLAPKAHAMQPKNPSKNSQSPPKNKVIPQ
jgi:hypothetical protein